MESSERKERAVAISSAAQVLPLVRREMAVDLAKAAIVFGVLAVGPYWLSGSTKSLYLAPFFLLVGALMMYTGRYIPISNRHDSLVRKYGDIYVEEIASAVEEHGVRTLLKTRWFETYADESCRRTSDSRKPG